MKKLKKMMAAIMAVMLTMNTGISVFAGNSAGDNAGGTAADYTLSSPGIEKEGNQGMVSEQRVTYDCVWFGSYPQTEVKEGDSAYASLKAATGWDANNDIVIGGTKYRRMQKGDATYATSGSSNYYDWEDGTTYHYFRYEPVKWRVLETDGSTAMLLSDVALDDQMYNTEYKDTTWETSTIRSWLNGYGAGDNQESMDYSSRNFIDSAFSKAEQDAIADTNVANDDNINYGTEGGNDTSDKLFLLSEKEACTETAAVHGFASSGSKCDEARRCKSSDYAKAMGVYSSTSEGYKGNCYWWLRSPGASGDNAIFVSSDGNIYSSGINVDINYYNGVRVALNLNLTSSNLYTYAGTVCSDGKVSEPEGMGDFSLSSPRIKPATAAGQKVTYDCVWFGSYPQTEVKGGDSAYVSLQDATGWDANNDIVINGTKYRRMQKGDATYATSGYSWYYDWEDDTTYHYFRYEPVKWRVLETDGSTAMLLSDVALDDQMYNTEYKDTTWETSTIRSWLNGYGAGDNQESMDYSSRNFIDSAFSKAEQDAIADTNVANDDNINYGTEGGNDTSDKLFLLSEKEACTETAAVHGFVSDYDTYDEARRCKSSDYAKAMGVESNTGEKYKGNCYWWLRSPGDSGDHARDVYNDGSISNFGHYVYYSHNGVRVALNLNLTSSNLYNYAGTVCTDGTVDEVGGAAPIPPLPTTKIKLNTTARTMLAGGRLTLKAKVTTDAKGIKVKWSSSDSKVASVTSKGTVTANKKGTAKITAATTDGKKATCKITVKAAPKSIKLNRTKLTLKKGKAFNLKYTITKNTYTTVTYKTSSKKVATVSSSGKVTAKKKGTAIITAATLNGKTAKCKVTVK